MWWGEVEATAEWVVPHPCVVDKNWEGYLGSKRYQPQARSHSPAFQLWEDKSPYLLVIKTSGGWGSRRNCWIFRRLFKGPTPTGIQQQGNSWKGASCIQEMGEMTGHGVSARQTLRSQPAVVPTQSHKAMKWVSPPW